MYKSYETSQVSPRELWAHQKDKVEFRGYGPVEIPVFVARLRTCARFASIKTQHVKPNFRNVTKLTRENADSVSDSISKSALGSIVILSGDTGVGKTTKFPARIFKRSKLNIYVVLPSELQVRDTVRYCAQYGARLDDGSSSVNPSGLVYTWAFIAVRRLVLDVLNVDVFIVDEAHSDTADVLCMKLYFASFTTHFRVVFMSATHPELTLDTCTHANGMMYQTIDFDENDVLEPDPTHSWYSTNSSGNWLVFEASREAAETLASKLVKRGHRAMVLSEYSHEENIASIRQELADARGLVMFVVVSPFYSTGFSLGVDNAIDMSVEEHLVEGEDGRLTSMVEPVTEVITHQRVGRVARNAGTSGNYVRRKLPFARPQLLGVAQIMTFQLWLSFLNLQGDVYGAVAKYSVKLAAVLLSLPYRPEVLHWYFDAYGRVYAAYADFLELVTNTTLERSAVDVDFKNYWPDGVTAPVSSKCYAHEFHRLAFLCKSRMTASFPDLSLAEIRRDVQDVDISTALRVMSTSPVFQDQRRQYNRQDREDNDDATERGGYTFPPSDKLQDRRVIRRKKPVPRVTDYVVPLRDNNDDDEIEVVPKVISRKTSSYTYPASEPTIVRRSRERRSGEPVAATIEAQVIEEEATDLDYRHPVFVLPAHEYRDVAVDVYLKNIAARILDNLLPYVNGEKVLSLETVEKQRVLHNAFVTAWNTNTANFVMAHTRYFNTRHVRWLNFWAWHDLSVMASSKAMLRKLQNVYFYFESSRYKLVLYDSNIHRTSEAGFLGELS